MKYRAKETRRLIMRLKILPMKDFRDKAVNKSDAVVKTTTQITMDKEAAEEVTENS